MWSGLGRRRREVLVLSLETTEDDLADSDDGGERAGDLFAGVGAVGHGGDAEREKCDPRAAKM
jgi:hypothetical protein